jgi:hypothetical protein
MSHLHLRCLDLVDERGQPAAAEYSPDADSGPSDNEIAAAILARAATIFQRGPPAPAHPICRTIVTERAVSHACMFTKPATPHKGNAAANSRIAALGFQGCNHPWEQRDRARRVPRLVGKRTAQMMFAVAVMDPTIKMLFYAAAVALFVLAAIGFERGPVSFVAAGLAAFVFPFFWNALAEV